MTETLHFERDRTIDYTLGLKGIPAEYAYKAVLDARDMIRQKNTKARTVYYDHTNKAIVADATVLSKSNRYIWTMDSGRWNSYWCNQHTCRSSKDDKFNLVNSPK